MNFLKVLDVTFFLLFAFFVVTRAPHTPWYFAGLALSAIAFPLWLLARRQLGRSFVVRAEAHQLVTTGLYARIRNPIYLFGGLALAGLFVAWKFWIGLVAAAVFNAAVQIVRVKREEQVLENAFGEEYRRYKARTWF